MSKAAAKRSAANPDMASLIEVDGQSINLRHRYVAALLAWLVPGAGHFYQGRRSKGCLFVVCILCSWILGFALGGGHVVYASWQPGDKRWHFALQAGVGAAAFPALIQGKLMNNHTTNAGETDSTYKPLWGGFMAPPQRPVIERNADQISAWYARSGAGYEMGTYYTMIAGLLNILVIYDAFSGPLSIPISGRRKEKAGPDSEQDAEPQSANEASPSFAQQEA